MGINRTGITRTVLLIGPWVFKVPSLRYAGDRWKGFLRGLLANMQERELSTRGFAILCPVVASLPGGFLVVMRRAQPLSNDEWSPFYAQQWIDRHGLPVENKRDSFGRIDGRIVALDYGGFAQ